MIITQTAAFRPASTQQEKLAQISMLMETRETPLADTCETGRVS